MDGQWPDIGSGTGGPLYNGMSELAWALFTEDTEGLANAFSQLQSAWSGYTETQEELATAYQDLANAQAEIDEAVAAQADAESAQADAEQAQADAESALTEAQAALTEAQAALTEAQADLTEATDTYASVISGLEGEVMLWQGEAGLWQGLYEQANADLDIANADLDAANENLQAANQNLENAQGQVTQLQGELLSAESNLEAAQEDLAAEQEKLENLANDASAKVDELSGIVAGLRESDAFGYTDEYGNQPVKYIVVDLEMSITTFNQTSGEDNVKVQEYLNMSGIVMQLVDLLKDAYTEVNSKLGGIYSVHAEELAQQAGEYEAQIEASKEVDVSINPGWNLIGFHKPGKLKYDPDVVNSRFVYPKREDNDSNNPSEMYTYVPEVDGEFHLENKGYWLYGKSSGILEFTESD